MEQVAAQRTGWGDDLYGKYLTFSLSKEKYAIEILKVQEIIGVLNTTPVPGSPAYLKGVINLRGRIIPVIDLRLKLSVEAAPYDEKTCVIVVNTKVGDKTVGVGIVVDTVLEVVHFGSGQLQPSPDYGNSLVTSSVLAMGKTVQGDVVILVDIEKVLEDTAIKDIIKEA